MKITPEQIRQMEKILENEGLEGRSLTWMYVGFEAQAEASEATIRRAMYGYVRCTITNASPVNEVGSRLQVRRTEYNLRKELTLSHPKDWEFDLARRYLRTPWMGAFTSTPNHLQAWRTLLC